MMCDEYRFLCVRRSIKCDDEIPFDSTRRCAVTLFFYSNGLLCSDVCIYIIPNFSSFVSCRPNYRMTAL